MKKWMIIHVLLLLLLTACQTLPSSGTVPAGSTPSSSSITPPTNSVAPPTSVPPTTPPVSDKAGYTCIYKGKNPFIGINPDFSGCKVGYLYWIDKDTAEVTSIVEELVLESIQEGAYVYYVKTAEPTKIYRTPIDEFSQHEVIYESIHGKVSAMVIDTFMIRAQTIMQFVADNKKFVVLDLDTGETAILTEQYYIRSAMFDHLCTDTWGEQTDFVFWGKIDENDSVQSYRYFIKTGEIRKEGACAD